MTFWWYWPDPHQLCHWIPPISLLHRIKYEIWQTNTDTRCVQTRKEILVNAFLLSEKTFRLFPRCVNDLYVCAFGRSILIFLAYQYFIQRSGKYMFFTLSFLSSLMYKWVHVQIVFVFLHRGRSYCSAVTKILVNKQLRAVTVPLQSPEALKVFTHYKNWFH